jgi:hypothetical protein
MYSRGLNKSPSREACDQAYDEAGTALSDPWRSPDKRASPGSARAACPSGKSLDIEIHLGVLCGDQG